MLIQRRTCRCPMCQGLHTQRMGRRARAAVRRSRQETAATNLCHPCSTGFQVPVSNARLPYPPRIHSAPCNFPAAECACFDHCQGCGRPIDALIAVKNTPSQK